MWTSICTYVVLWSEFILSIIVNIKKATYKIGKNDSYPIDKDSMYFYI